MVWYGLGLKASSSSEERSSSSCRGRRGGQGEAGEAEAGAARAGAAAWSSEVSEAGAVVVGLGPPGDAGRERGSGATSGRHSSSEASSDGEAKGHPDHRG